MTFLPRSDLHRITASELGAHLCGRRGHRRTRARGGIVNTCGRRFSGTGGQLVAGRLLRGSTDFWRLIFGPLDELAVFETAPARTSATRCGALTTRQRCSAAWMSLKAMASPAAFDPAPLVTLSAALPWRKSTRWLSPASTDVSLTSATSRLRYLDDGFSWLSTDRKQPPHGGQQPATPGSLAAGGGCGLREYGECW